MTGTFKFDSKASTFVFRDDRGNSASWDEKSAFGWQVWSKGGKCEADCMSLPEALSVMETLKEGN